MKRIISILLVCVLCAMAFAACNKADNTESGSGAAGQGGESSAGGAAGEETGGEPAGEGEPFYIAVSAPFTGDDAQYGTFFRNGIEMRKDEINAAGGIDGRMIEVEYIDDKSTPQEASNVAQLITEDARYIAAIGSYNSTCVLAGAPIFEQAGMVQMAPCAGHPDITLANRYLFRNQNSNDIEFTWLADIAVNALNKERIAIVHLNNDSGIVLKDILNETIPQLGGEVVAIEGYIQGQVSDFSPILTNLRAVDPDLVICVTSYNDMGTMLQQAKGMGVELEWLSSGMIYSDAFIELAGDAGEGVHAMTIFFADNPDPEIAAFTAEYRSRNGGETPNYFATTAYESMAMIEHALRQGANDRESLYQELLKIREWDGVTGYATFDEDRMVNRAMTIIKVEDGQWVLAEDVVG